MKDQDDEPLPFKSTIITGLGDDVYKINDYIPILLLFCVMAGICGIIVLADFILFLFGVDFWLINVLVFPYILLLLCITIGLFFIFFKIKNTLISIPKSILPIRIKTKLELLPNKTDNIPKEFFIRMRRFRE